MAQAAALSICVPTIGRPSLADLLASIDAARGGRDVDVVVADASGAVRACGARVVPNPAGTASAGRNASAAAARGEVLVYVDDDCRLDPTYLERLATRLADEPRVAAFAGLTVRDAAEHPLQAAWSELFDGPFRAVAERAWTRWAPSTNFVIRRAAFEALGGFAALPLPVGGEDIDLGLRLTEAGLGPIRCAPELLARHAPEDPAKLEEKARRYGASEQLVGDLHPGYQEAPRPRALLFPDTPRGRLLRSFVDGASRVHSPPRRHSAVLMADCGNGRDGRLAWLRAPAGLREEACAALEAAGHVVLERAAEGATVYLRGRPPWAPVALPAGATLERSPRP